MHGSLTRRGLLLLGGGLLLGGCSATSTTPGADDSKSTGSRGSAEPSRAPARPPTASRAPHLPEVTQWYPDSGDVTPEAKRAAVRAVEYRGNQAHSALQVIDAQYGGILADTASVLVVCRTWRSTPAGTKRGGRTYDVRLARSGSKWQVMSVHPSHPGVPAHQRTVAAREVLASSRIELPPAARGDVLSGQVHDTVLTSMLRLAGSYRIGVSVVRSGHPVYVFGTDRLSDHPQGRAFDTWRIDDKPVVDPETPRGLVTGYMQAAAAAGSYNVGGPYLLGSAPQYFSDATHHDHIHVGFAT